MDITSHHRLTYHCIQRYATSPSHPTRHTFQSIASSLNHQSIPYPYQSPTEQSRRGTSMVGKVRNLIKVLNDKVSYPNQHITILLPDRSYARFLSRHISNWNRFSHNKLHFSNGSTIQFTYSNESETQ